MCKRSDSDMLALMEEEVQSENVETFPTKIILAKRGKCTFVDKVRNAERAGASLLVVVDNKAENVTNVIMGDDGTGTGLRIPSMLVGKSDGHKLIEFAKKRVGATLSAEFAVKEKQDIVNVEIWYSSNNQRSLDFIKEFGAYVPRLEGYVRFHPRQVTWACEACTKSFKEDECFSDGKYCAPNHVRDDFNRVLGRDIIYEDLRESCVHKQMHDLGKENGWWDYMAEVHSECFGFISKACSRNAHQRVGLDFAKTEACVEESFFGPDHSTADNSFLRDNSEAWKEYGTLYWPSVTIDRVTFRGDITPENILEDICANLNTMPDLCVKYFARDHINYEEQVVKGPDAISAELVIGIVLVLVGVNVVLILAYRKCVKKEMEDTMGVKVRSAVTQYISVAQSTRNNTGTSLEMD